jgi:hypothetical protein
LFKQFAASLWITSLIKQLAATLLKSDLLQLDIFRLTASYNKLIWLVHRPFTAHKRCLLFG